MAPVDPELRVVMRGGLSRFTARRRPRLSAGVWTGSGAKINRPGPARDAELCRGRIPVGGRFRHRTELDTPAARPAARAGRSEFRLSGREPNLRRPRPGSDSADGWPASVWPDAPDSGGAVHRQLHPPFVRAVLIELSWSRSSVVRSTIRDAGDPGSNPNPAQGKQWSRDYPNAPRC